MIKADSLKSILKKEYLSFIFACACVIIMPLHVQFIPPFMVMWGMSRILELWMNKCFRLKMYGSSFHLFILFMVFYLWQLVGIIYSHNVNIGWNIFFSRLSLFLFPFVLIVPGEKVLKNVKLLLKLFAISTTLFILFCFINAFYKSISFQNGVFIFYPHPPEAKWLSYFYGSYFSIIQHPSYLAMYVILSVFIAFESWFEKDLKSVIRIFWLILSVFLLISIYFLSSRSGIISIVLLIPFYLIFRLIGKAKVKANWQRITVFISVLFISFALFQITRLNDRMKSGINSISDGSYKQAAIRDGRVIIWHSALKIIRENAVFGVGIGDVKDELMKEYQIAGNKDLIEKRYNVHNQFLEIAVESGLIGLLFFLTLMGYMIRTAFKTKNILYSLFLIMIIIFFMFESILYRLAGVTFFALFSFLLIHLDSKSVIPTDLKTG